MRANEFVKKFGWTAAMDLWCGAFDLYSNNLQILNGMVCRFSDNKFLFDLLELKRLIKSHELVEKATPEELYAAESQEGIWSNHRLKQAIADVESCHV